LSILGTREKGDSHVFLIAVSSAHFLPHQNRQDGKGNTHFSNWGANMKLFVNFVFALVLSLSSLTIVADAFAASSSTGTGTNTPSRADQIRKQYRDIRRYLSPEERECVEPYLLAQIREEEATSWIEICTLIIPPAYLR